MSLARTALRLAVIGALEADPVVSAFCAGRILDSRIDDIGASEVLPFVIVFTGDEHGRAYSANNGGPPFDSAVDLNLEISMRIRAPAAPDPDAGPEAPPPTVDLVAVETDSELEAALDLIEHAAVAAVAIGDAPASVLVRKVLCRVTEHRSVRYASAETGAKLAMRLVTLTAELIGDSGPASPLDVPVGPFAALPEPLRSVAAGLPAGSAALATVQALVAKLPPVAAPVPFSGAADVVYAPQRLDPCRPPDPEDPRQPVIRQEIDLARPRPQDR